MRIEWEYVRNRHGAGWLGSSRALFMVVIVLLWQAGAGAAWQDAGTPPDLATLEKEVQERFSGEDWPAVCELTSRIQLESTQEVRAAEWESLLYMRCYSQAELGMWGDVFESATAYLKLDEPDRRARHEEFIRFIEVLSLYELRKPVELRRRLSMHFSDYPGSSNSEALSHVILPLLYEEPTGDGELNRVEWFVGVSKFDESARYQSSLKEARECLEGKMLDLTREFSLEMGDWPKIRVIVEDGGGEFEKAVMRTQLGFEGETPIAVVRIYSESLMVKPTAIAKALRHELGHCLMLKHPRKVREPEWVEEGIAAWIEADTRARAESMAASRVANQPSKVEEELQRPLLRWRAGWSQSPEWAVVRGVSILLEVESELGRGKFIDVIRSTIRGGSFIAEVARLSGKTRVRLAVEWEAAVRAWVGRCSVGIGKYRAAKALYSEGKWSSAERLYAEFMEDYDGCALIEFAELERAYCLVSMGEYGSALSVADLWAAKHEIGGAGRLLMLVRVLAFNGMGQWKDAISEGEMFLMVYSRRSREYAARVERAMEEAREKYEDREKPR